MSTLDTTRDVIERVRLVEVGSVIHLASPSWTPRCHEVRAVEHRRFYGSAAAITCAACRRAFEKQEPTP